jgi:hypothetical protein
MPSPSLIAMQEEEEAAQRQPKPLVHVAGGGGAPPAQPPSPPDSGGGAGRPGGVSARLTAREVFVVLAALRHASKGDSDNATVESARNKIRAASADAETGLTLIP